MRYELLTWLNSMRNSYGCMQHWRQEQIVQLMIREKLLKNERKKRLKEAAAARKKALLIRKVLAYGGP